MKRIESSQNPLIKNILRLQEKSRERKKQGLFVIEGKREIQLALQGGYKVTKVLYWNEVDLDYFNDQSYGFEIIQVSPEVYQKIAYRESTEGILAIAEIKPTDLSNLKLSKDSLIVVAEGIEKPGNIGAMLRSADAANIDAFILANPRTDLYNPNVIRSSVGCVFTNPLATGSSDAVLEFLKDNNIAIFSATLQNSNDYTTCNYRQATAIVVGTEATGLSEIWRTSETNAVHIPMEGAIDSMNVSVATAVILFEAKRQRKVS